MAEASTEIVPSLSFETLLARRAAAVEQLNIIAKAVRSYGEIGLAIFGAEDARLGRHVLAGPFTFREPLELRPTGRGEHIDSEKWLEAGIAAVDAALWDHLFDLSGLRSFLDKKAREEWAKQIEERATPPLTAENVRATFAGIHAQRKVFFERGVIEVFKSLSWDFKTNRPNAFGKRLVVTHIWDGWGPNARRTDSMDDLERVLSVLDGKPEPDHRQGWSAKIWEAKRNGACPHTLETEYLRIKLFKNGNGHVEFLRMPLVDELNRILASHYPDALSRTSEPEPEPGTCPLAVHP